MLSRIFELDRRLEIGNARLKRDFPEYESLEPLIDQYLEKYADFNRLHPETIVKLYEDFSKQYARHLKTFQETNQYPHEYGSQATCDRLSYDIALILSCAITAARFQIVQHLFHYSEQLTQNRICVIGTGAGIELEIICSRKNNVSITAYDMAFNDFVKNNFSALNLKEEYFYRTQAGEHFDTIFAIELLEHLPNPQDFLKNIYASLNTSDRLVCTTATNMPQFDHLYNFSDIPQFKKELHATGFHIITHREFKQPYTFNGLEAKNDWFVLEK